MCERGVLISAIATHFDVRHQMADEALAMDPSAVSSRWRVPALLVVGFPFAALRFPQRVAQLAPVV